MSIHQSAPTQWVPVTDEILRGLEGQYLHWITDLTEIRERMDGLRDAHRAGWKPPAELQERLNDLHERDELYAAKHLDVARSYLAAAERDVNATQIARTEQRTQLIAALVDLKRAWENGWEKADKWTETEKQEIKWLIYCNPELKSLFNISAGNVAYFCQKYERLRKAGDHKPERRDFGGNVIPLRQSSRRSSPYRKH